MNQYQFKILSAPDEAYWDAAQEIAAQCGESVANCEFGFVFGGEYLKFATIDEAKQSEELKTIFNAQGSTIAKVMYRLGSGREIIVERKERDVFDEVTIKPVSAEDRNRATFSKLIATSQNVLGRKGSINQPLLSADKEKFYQLQETALQQLHAAITHAARQAEENRTKYDEEFRKKDAALEKKFQDKNADLDKKHNAKVDQFEEQKNKDLKEIADEREKLSSEAKKLDDRNATHARRQHQTEIDTIFANLDTSGFGLSDKTYYKGYAVIGATAVAIIASAIVTGIMLNNTLIIPEGEGYVPVAKFFANAIKAVVFTALTISLIVFLIRWLNQWYQGHANEELRLKRLRLDLKRAVWFVETAREWTEKKDAEMPKEIVDRLTAGLFSAEADSTPTIEPKDALANILLGGSKTRIDYPGGSAEYDRKDIRKLNKEET